MKDYTVSACIVSYNNGDKILNTIDSVLKNTVGVKLELYVVDNGSTDGSTEKIKSAFPSVKVIESGENNGFGAGHNKVLPLINSKYHVVINPDIILKDDSITKLCDFADSDSDIGLLSPKILFENGEEQKLGKKNPTPLYLGVHFFHKNTKPSKIMDDYCMTNAGTEPFEITNATGCFMFFKTEVFKKLGGFDERFFMYLEDCDIARRASKISRVLHCPDIEVYHLWERASKKSKKLLKIHIQSIIKYFLKWGITGKDRK